MIKENNDSGGIQTHASEDTAIWTRRQRPLGNLDYAGTFRRVSVYVRDLHLASNASQKFGGYCKPLVQGQPELEKK